MEIPPPSQQDIRLHLEAAASDAEEANDTLYELLELALSTKYPAEGETQIIDFREIGLGVRRWPPHRAGSRFPNTWYVDRPNMICEPLTQTPLPFVLQIARHLAK